MWLTVTAVRGCTVLLTDGWCVGRLSAPRRCEMAIVGVASALGEQMVASLSDSEEVDLFLVL